MLRLLLLIYIIIAIVDLVCRKLLTLQENGYTVRGSNFVKIDFATFIKRGLLLQNERIHCQKQNSLRNRLLSKGDWCAEKQTENHKSFLPYK